MEPGPTKRKPFVCKCGEASFLFGESYAFCKACRRKVVRPKEGYADREGNPLDFTIWRCPDDDRLTMTRNAEEAPSCSTCGNTALEKMKVF